MSSFSVTSVAAVKSVPGVLQFFTTLLEIVSSKVYLLYHHSQHYLHIYCYFSAVTAVTSSKCPPTICHSGSDVASTGTTQIIPTQTKNDAGGLNFDNKNDEHSSLSNFSLALEAAVRSVPGMLIQLYCSIYIASYLHFLVHAGCQ